jgi:2-deoxy-D-gluconate 3-dehydrogenase
VIASIAQAWAEVIAALSGLDVLVNNAGVNLRKEAIEVIPQEWDAMMNVNLRGTFFLTQKVGRHLIGAARGGCIVTIASTYALVGAPERSIYAISKAAVIGMTRMLAVEWAAHNIRVNAIAPGRLMTASPSRAHKGGRSFLHGGDAQTHPLAPAGKCRRGRLRRSLSRIYC